MKKQLVASLAAAMVLGVAGTSFAAANPFVDVPAKHWAYASVMTLSQAGIVDGDNGKFMGDKMISRYEMAQIVAKAMAKSDKADAKQKAMIEKLAAEFSEELTTMGVRVTALEKNQANLKFNGNLLLRYTAKDFVNNDAKTDNTGAVYRLRLEGAAMVDENTTFNTRYVTRDTMKTKSLVGLPAGSSARNFGKENAESADGAFDRFNVVSKIGDTTVTAGRMSLVVGTTSAIVDSGAHNFDGVKLAAPIGQVTAVVNHGRLVDRKDVDSVELSTKTGKLAYGVGNYRIQDNGSGVQGYGVVHKDAVVANWNDTTKVFTPAKDASDTYSLGKDVMKLWYGYATYNFEPKLSLTVEGGQNKADYATSDNKFYNIIAKMGDQALNAKGKQNYALQYFSVGKNALALDSASAGMTTLDTAVTTSKFTGWDFSYNRAFSKNLSSEFHYVKVADKSNDINNYDYFRVNVVSKF